MRADNIRPYGGLRWCVRRGRCPQRPATTAAPPTTRQKTPHPAIAAQPVALLNKGSRKLTTPTAERQRAGKGAQPQVCTRAGRFSSQLPFRMAPQGSGAAAPVIFGYFPSLESSSPAGETPSPARRRETLPSMKRPAPPKAGPVSACRKSGDRKSTRLNSSHRT